MERQKVRPADRARWRKWLSAHHATSPGVWVEFPKKSSGLPGPTYEDLVEEALCFGWVDSTSGRVDDLQTRVYFAPRRKGSTWAATNRARVARLMEAGLMTAAGLAAIDRAKSDGSWTMLDAIDSATIPPDLESAFRQYPGSREKFEAFTLSTRRQLLYWIVSAKRSQTRERRVDETARLAREGIRATDPRPKDTP